MESGFPGIPLVSGCPPFCTLVQGGRQSRPCGDVVKQAKEGRFMPGVKKLFQESEYSSKPEYIFGHMFGGLGILAIGANLRKRCTKLA